MSTFPNKLVIECPSETASFWREQDELKNLFNGNNLILRIPSEFYSKVTQGKGVKLLKGATVSLLDTDSKFLGFRVVVPDGKEALRLLITELANYTAGNDSCEGNPIIINDYHYRHNRQDWQRGYRIRTGIFTGEISEVKGSVTRGYLTCEGEEIKQGTYYSNGFGFRFMETLPTGYF